MSVTAARALLGGWITAGKAFVAQYVEIFYAIIAIAVLVLAGWSVWRVMSWRAGYLERDQAVAALKAEQDCRPGTHCAATVAGLQAAGVQAVEQARQAAAEAAREAEARRVAEAQAAVGRAAAATSEARARADQWRQRYEREKATRQECKAWSDTPLGCQP